MKKLLIFLLVTGCQTTEIKEGKVSLYERNNFCVVGGGSIYNDHDNFNKVIKQNAFNQIGVEF